MTMHTKKLNRFIIATLATALSLPATPLRAQGTGTNAIDRILQQIETNNPQLQANAQLTASQKLANMAENNLPDPTVSYAHLWDSDDKNITVGELVIAQSFDFPTLYATRRKLNRQRNTALDAQAESIRQEVLLQAKELCLDIIMLNRQQALLDQRLKNAEDLADLYRQKLATGEASRLETNKINLELLNVRAEQRTNQTALNNKVLELTALNNGKPLAVNLTDYPQTSLPEDFSKTCTELLAADPSLQTLRHATEAARRQLSASKQGWLPSLQLGYRRNTETRHPLNGIVVGFSIPIFQNRSKVKAAKSEVLNNEFMQQNTETQTTSVLWQRYNEARELQRSMKELQQALEQQQDLTLLRKALDAGQISMIEYFVEVTVIYQSQSNLLTLENQYHKAVAQIYKSRL